MDKPKSISQEVCCPNCKLVFEVVVPSETSLALRSLSGGKVLLTPTEKTNQDESPPWTWAPVSSDLSQTSSPALSPLVGFPKISYNLGNDCDEAFPFDETTYVDVVPDDQEPLDALSENIRLLRLSGWFFDSLSYTKSDRLLTNTSVGTFLLRTSSDPNYLFSLSVQTENGPSSVRLHYINGRYRLDALPTVQSAMPTFQYVIELIEHYAKGSQYCKPRTGSGSAHVWVDKLGRWYSAISITKPYLKDSKPQSLKHLTRRAIMRSIKNSQEWRTSPHPSMRLSLLDNLELPKELKGYLEEYPYYL